MSVLLNMDTGLHEQVVVTAAGNSHHFVSAATTEQQATDEEGTTAADTPFRSSLPFDLQRDLPFGLPSIAYSTMFSPSAGLADTTTANFFDEHGGRSESPSIATDNSDSNSSTSFDLKSLTLNAGDASIKVGSLGRPCLIIHEQPVEKFRFRYKSEMHGTHGSLSGCSSGKKKTFPSVRLHGYADKAIIQCTLHQTDKYQQRLHSHLLVVRRDDSDCRDPHEVHVNADEGYRAEFPGMGIIHTARKYIVDELFEKLLDRYKLLNGKREATELERERLRLRADKESKEMNLNQVCLCFEAFRVVGDNYERLCEPVYSYPINNMKSALTGELKITRLSATCCDAGGNTELFLFVEKVGKNNIQVRFFEQDENEDITWEDFGQFSASDVHHQYAIALRTPPYRNKDIVEKVHVFVQLLRKSDQCYSKPLPFEYKPRPNLWSRKRLRMGTSINSGELPTTLPRHNISNPIGAAAQCAMDTDSVTALTISKEFNTSAMIDELLERDPILMAFDHLVPEDDYLEADGFANRKHSGNRVAVQQSGAGSVNNRIEDNVRLLRQQIDRVARTQSFQKARAYLRQMWVSSNARMDILHRALSDEHSDTAAQLLIGLLASYELVELLNVPDPIQHNFALHTACLFNRHACVAMMLRLGAKPNVLDPDDNTPLHLAVIEPFPECVRALCDASNYPDAVSTLHIDATNRMGYTALHLAIREKHLDMVETLTAAGASATKREPQTGNTGLHLAVQSNSCDIVAHLMAATSVSVADRNEANYTALDLASMDANTTNLDIVDMLRTECPMIVLDTTTSPSNVVDVTPPATEFQAKDESPHDATTGNVSMRSSATELFDAICTRELSTIFNVDEGWRRLADMMNLSDFVGLWQTAKDPTLTMFRFAETQGFQLPHVVKIFVELDNRQALSCLDEMIARRVEME